MKKYALEFTQFVDVWAESEDEALAKAVGEVDGYEDSPITAYDSVKTLSVEEGKPYNVILLYPYAQVVEVIFIPAGTPAKEITRLLDNKGWVTAYDIIKEYDDNNYMIMHDNKIIGFVTPSYYEL